MQFLDNTILYTILGLAGGTMAVQYCCTSGCGICIKTPCGIYDSGCMGPIFNTCCAEELDTKIIDDADFLNWVEEVNNASLKDEKQ